MTLRFEGYEAVAAGETLRACLGDVAGLEEAFLATSWLVRNQAEADARGIVDLAARRKGQRAAADAVASARREITALTIDGLAAEARARLELAVRQGQNAAAILAEQQARSDETGSLAREDRRIEAKADEAAGAVAQERSERIASIAATDQALVSGDEVNAESIRQVTTRVDDVEVTAGLLLESRNANEGRALFGVDANGIVTGIEAYGRTDGTSGIVMRAKTIAFVTDDGTNPQPMFFQTAQGVTLNTAFFRNALAAPNPLSTIFLPLQLEPLRVRGVPGTKLQYDSGRTFGKNPVRIEADLGPLPALPTGSSYRFRPTQVQEAEEALDLIREAGA